MQILCTVDIRTRELYLEDVTIAAFDHLVDDVLFVIEPIDGFQLETSTIKIAAVGPLGEPHDYEIDPSTVTVDEETGNINFVWSIPVGVTAMPLTAFKISDTKNITFAVCAEIVSGDNLVKAWHSDDGTIKVKAHLEPESGGGEDPSEEATNAQKIGQLQTATAILQREISGIASGTPPTADSTSEMDHDESTVYINTTDGNWYYWNGSAWQIGGVYGGAVTSTTFNQKGVPADDFAVGQALAGKADADDVDAIDDRVTALESGGSGLSEDGKQALLAIARSVVYTGPNGQELYNALYNAFYPPANLLGITVVYTQSKVVTTETNIESLRSDIVVTARYTDGTSSVVTDYFLSGELTSGDSTITVSYSGKTATFSVHVVGALYSLPEPTVFDGTNYIDTEVKLASEDIDYTIQITGVAGQIVQDLPIFHCVTEAEPYPGIGVQKGNNLYYKVVGFEGKPAGTLTSISALENDTFRIVLRHEKGSQYLYLDFVSNGVRGEQVVLNNNGTFRSSQNNLLIACYQNASGTKGRFWRGTIQDFTILSDVVSDSAVTEYLGV